MALEAAKLLKFTIKIYVARFILLSTITPAKIVSTQFIMHHFPSFSSIVYQIL